MLHRNLRTIVLGLLTGAALATCALLVIAFTSAPPLLDREMAAAVMVDIGADGSGGHGSGFAIAPDRVITAAHVTEGQTEFLVTTSDGRKFPAEVLWQSPTHDTALLKLLDGDSGSPNLTPAGLACRAPVLDEAVTLIGNQGIARFRVSHGTVSSVTPPEWGPGAPDGQMSMGTLLNLPAGHGDSGAPVFDADGRVLGLLEGGMSRGDYPVVWMVPATRICELLVH